jgi:hypothetical protein
MPCLKNKKINPANYLIVSSRSNLDISGEYIINKSGNNPIYLK